MSQQIAQQAIRIREEKFVATKEFLVMTEIAKDLEKSCRDRVARLKSNCLLQQTQEEQGHEKLGANRFGVATQGIPVATKTRLLNTIYVATLSKYVTTQFKSKPREQVVTEYKKLRQRQRQRMKALS